MALYLPKVLPLTLPSPQWGEGRVRGLYGEGAP